MIEGSANVPRPPAERARWAFAGALLIAAVATLVVIASGRVGRVAPPPLPARAATPQAGSGRTRAVATGSRRYVSDEQPGAFAHAAAAGRRSRTRARAAASARRQGARGRPAAVELGQAGPPEALGAPVSQRWMEGFYPIYEVAQRSFHVSWLLIASIQRQETAFSTAPGTYEGLNFAGCCGGPMQFNVRNGPISTWDLVKGSYRAGPRPRHYDHRTARHPSIYDDFDSIMAAAHLLELDGAGMRLEDAAWLAAYDYYGHDAHGVAYADEVIARAIGWSQHGFCASCATSASLLHAVGAAYGAPVLSQLQAEGRAHHAHHRGGGAAGRARSSAHAPRSARHGAARRAGSRS
ncbi:MAG: hypothetical protein ACYCUM_01575 [Solirubrobacteraceae bacterium]